MPPVFVQDRVDGRAHRKPQILKSLNALNLANNQDVTVGHIAPESQVSADHKYKEPDLMEDVL